MLGRIETTIGDSTAAAASGRAFVRLRDVTLRDGLQSEAVIATESKIALARAIVAAGVPEIEVASFVRPDKVPTMADAALVLEGLADLDVPQWVLVLNASGARRAVEAGATHLTFVVSISEEHSRRNAGRTPAAALDECAVIAREFPDVHVELTLATAFGCPYRGQIGVDEALTFALHAREQTGIDALVFADTIGVAAPNEVSALLEAARSAGVGWIGVHLHDTRGLGIANALAAVSSGVDRIDAALGGLGGCPFAPGASGNLPIEDLVHCLDAMTIPTGVRVDGLLAAAQFACDAVGRPVESHIGIAGPRFVALDADTGD
jgi:hydroxymethylglutaryl-CoA lyase